MRYVEHENVIYRSSEARPAPMSEKLIDGVWIGAGIDAYKATVFGTPMTLQEAKLFAGDEWPAELAEEPRARGS